MFKRYSSHIVVVIIGVVSGFSIQMNWLANVSAYRHFSLDYVFTLTAVSASVVACVLLVFHTLTIKKMNHYHLVMKPEKLALWDAYSYLPMLCTAVGIWGIKVTPILFSCIVVAIILIKLFILIKAMGTYYFMGVKSGLGLLFMISGFAALIYQIAWQRVLFATFGINIESVTLIISVFMFGLGIGSLIGGYLSEKFSNHLPHLFFFCEFAIGLFGVISLYMIRGTSDVIIDGEFMHVAIAIFGLLCFPTAMMGATLPILVTYINHVRNNVGDSIGWLYFSNTLGSSVAALMTVMVLFPLLGLQGSVWVAAFFNFLVGFVVLYHTRHTSNLVTEITEVSK